MKPPLYKTLRRSARRALHRARAWRALIRTARLRWRFLVGAERIVVADMFGHRYWQYRDDDLFYYCHTGSLSDAKPIVRYILANIRSGSVCVDIGANVGSVSVPLWAGTDRTGRVISIEADPRNIPRLRANLVLNGFGDEGVIHLAITDRPGPVPLRCYPGANGWQTMGAPAFAEGRPYDVVDVPGARFDVLRKSLGLGGIDFLKIDVEGAELLVLRGMRALLEAREVGCVVFEVNQAALAGMGFTEGELLAFWSDLDYQLWRLEDAGTLTPIRDGWPEGLFGDCVALAGSPGTRG